MEKELIIPRNDSGSYANQIIDEVNTEFGRMPKGITWIRSFTAIQDHLDRLKDHPEYQAIRIKLKNMLEEFGIGMSFAEIQPIDGEGEAIMLDDEYASPSFGFVHGSDGESVAVGIEIAGGRNREITPLSRGLRIASATRFSFSQALHVHHELGGDVNPLTVWEYDNLVVQVPLVDREKLEKSHFKFEDLPEERTRESWYFCKYRNGEAPALVRHLRGNIGAFV